MCVWWGLVCFCCLFLMVFLWGGGGGGGGRGGPRQVLPLNFLEMSLSLFVQNIKY